MAFPCSVYSCYGTSAAIAFIIDSNYISHWLAHTFIFTSISLINPISMIIEIEFDECYKTCDFRDKYNALALPFPLIYHILSPFFSPAIFVAVSSPLFLSFSVHLSHFFTFCCLSALNSLHLPGKARERAVRGEHVQYV